MGLRCVCRAIQTGGEEEVVEVELEVEVDMIEERLGGKDEFVTGFRGREVEEEEVEVEVSKVDGLEGKKDIGLLLLLLLLYELK